MFQLKKIRSNTGLQIALDKRARQSRILLRCNAVGTMAISLQPTMESLNLGKETMDNRCVVCRETLEWVAYGPCGHREVCSTCVARLRFICNDRRCCLCQSESKIIFVTKGLCGFTKTINDFSIFPNNPTEGKVGTYWYHEGTQAYFDDFHHYNKFKVMCRISCNVCDEKKRDKKISKKSKRKGKFKEIEQLKNHLHLAHELSFCSLCLKERKVFLREQKLYTRIQLNQHIDSGDSEVGFSGHPSCKFCRIQFYGDNELCLHMSTEHFTCHICQRQNPGKYEYYGRYDDLETHFRREHYFCEDESCLADKFIVFATESEMQRHIFREHGRDNCPPSKHHADLQKPQTTTSASISRVSFSSCSSTSSNGSSTENKLLVENIRSTLNFDNEKFTAFKEITKDYKRGLIDSSEYLACVDQFGLSHLVLDLTDLCPNAQKQKELIETYNFNLRGNNGGSKNKGKEKCQDNGICCSKKDGYQSIKGKAKAVFDIDCNNQQKIDLRIENDSYRDGGLEMHTETWKKQRNKSSKFDRVKVSKHDSYNKKKRPSQDFPVSSVWQNGGVSKLVLT